MVQAYYHELLDKISKIVNEQAKCFSIFDMLGQSTRELTHSAFIAQMLNPHGDHEMGNTLLNLFLEQLSLQKEFDTDDVEVEIEKDLGPKEGSGKKVKGGRIDIYIKNSKGQIIVIENKIYASDQDDQLQRYRNSVPNGIIIYLTLDGHTPSNCSSDIKYKQISYKNEIREWLKNCLNCLPDTHPLKTITIQYMSTISSLTSDQEVTETIQSSSSYIRASLQIARLAVQARVEMKKRFLKELACHLKLKDKTVIKEGAEWKLKAEDCEWCIEYNLFVRFLSSDAQTRWEYIKYKGKTLNFHEFNSPASLWCDNPEIFWAEFDPVINDFKSKYQLK